MEFWIGVMALCMSKTQACSVDTTSMVFLTEAKCQEYVSKNYVKKVHCIKPEILEGQTERVMTAPDFTSKKPPFEETMPVPSTPFVGTNSAASPFTSETISTSTPSSELLDEMTAD